MIHYMKLNPNAFHQMTCGEKTIELNPPYRVGEIIFEADFI